MFEYDPQYFSGDGSPLAPLAEGAKIVVRDGVLTIEHVALTKKKVGRPKKTTATVTKVGNGAGTQPSQTRRKMTFIDDPEVAPNAFDRQLKKQVFSKRRRDLRPPAELVSVKCFRCGKTESVSEVLAGGGLRGEYVCNDCLVGR